MEPCSAAGVVIRPRAGRPSYCRSVPDRGKGFVCPPNVSRLAPGPTQPRTWGVHVLRSPNFFFSGMEADRNVEVVGGDVAVL